MGSKSNQPISVDKYNLVVSQRFVKELSARNPLIPAVVTLAVLIGILYWFFGTEYGSGLRATGANRRMASAQGIDTRVAVTVGLMLSNGLVALSGALLAQYQGSSDINMGRGAIVYYIVLQIVLQIGLNTNDLKLITALIVALFLTLSYLNLKKTRRKPRRAAKEGVEQHA